MHRNSGREPFYKESVDLLISQKGIEFSRHCEGCHIPVALISGALKTGSLEPRTLDDEGVTCSVCHSIVQTTVHGTGSYVIAPPALLLRADGRAVRDATDAEVLADIESHRRAVMRPLLRSASFCAACHKSGVPPDLSHHAFLQKGFDVYDEWQVSAYSGEVAATALRDGKTRDCRSCHMPSTVSLNDQAAKQGRIKSHRWLGANTAVPLFYQAAEQFRQTQAFLEADVVAVQIFAVENQRTGKRVVTSAGEPLSFTGGDRLIADVLVSNQGAGHAFPPEIRDLYEAWVEFSVEDARGSLVARSGALDAHGQLDERAHVYRQTLVDRDLKRQSRHEVWNAIAKECDNRILPGQPDLVRYRIEVPKGAGFPLRLRARVKYRRFNRDYSNYVSERRRMSLQVPTVTMASDETLIGAEATARHVVPSDIARRWNEYGLALLAKSDRRAVTAFRTAAQLDPKTSEYRLREAIAELRAQRSEALSVHANRTSALLANLAESSPKTEYISALARLAAKDVVGAESLLKPLTSRFPNDREAWRQSAIVHMARQSWGEAEQALMAVLRIDPLDADALQLLGAVVERGGGDSERVRAIRSEYQVLSHFANAPVRGTCEEEAILITRP